MIPWLDTSEADWDFPPINDALDDPNGLLCAGGDLKADTLLRAYGQGIFPWYSENQPILWWSPRPRAIFRPDEIHISRRLRRTLRSGRFTVKLDQDFGSIIWQCANIDRPDQQGTWLTVEMIEAYRELYRLGHAHCLGVYQDGQLVGGVYGLAIGRGFFGESMFSATNNASKIALVALCDFLQTHKFGFLDAQVESPHILRMGAQLIDRMNFSELLEVYCRREGVAGSWRELHDTVQSPPFAYAHSQQ